MARFFNVALCLAVVIVAVSAQFDYFGGYPGGFGAAAPRDPRDNRGPVTFPITQPGSETSGVRVGASGFGFIPPGSRGGQKPIHLSKQTIPRRTKLQIGKIKNLRDFEGLIAKAMSNLVKTQEEAKVETDIHREEAEENANDSLEEAKTFVDEELLHAKRKVELFMKNWNLQKMRSNKRAKGAGPYGSGPSAFEGLRYW